MDRTSARGYLGPTLLALALATLAFAGCAGNDTGNGAAYGADTGAIRGSAITDEGLPVPEAWIGLGEDAERKAVADSRGVFVFSNLEPGNYSLIARAPGFVEAARTVRVEAGMVAETQIVLSDVPPLQPHTVTIGPVAGKFFCAFGFRVGTEGVAGPCRILAFGGHFPVNVEPLYQMVAGDERNNFDYPTILADNASNPEDEWRSVVIELTWEPTSGAAEEMNLQVTRYDPQGRIVDTHGSHSETATYAFADGKSPVRITLLPNETSAGGDVAMPANETGFTVGVSPAYAEPPVVYTEQRFEHWITVFYNRPHPEGFTALDDTDS